MIVQAGIMCPGRSAARSEAQCCAADPVAALKAYEDERLPPTTQVVLTNRSNPPDAILQEVYKRTGDKPFWHIDDVISQAELASPLKRYQRVAGFDREKLEAGGNC